jgi:hypothetical protein
MMEYENCVFKRNISTLGPGFVGPLDLTNQVGKVPGEVPQKNSPELYLSFRFDGCSAGRPKYLRDAIVR